MKKMNSNASNNERKNILTKIIDKNNLTNYFNSENSNFGFKKNVFTSVNSSSVNIEAEKLNSHTIIKFNKASSQTLFKNMNFESKNDYNNYNENEKNRNDKENVIIISEYDKDIKQQLPDKNSEMHESVNCFFDGHKLLLKNIEEKNSKKENDIENFLIIGDVEDDDEIDKNNYNNMVIEEFYLKTKTNNILKEKDFKNEVIRKKFKNLENSYLRKEKKKFSFGPIITSENRYEASFCPQLTCKNSVYKADETVKLSIIDPYVTCNSYERATEATNNKLKGYDFTNFFLSTKNKDLEKNSNLYNAENKQENSNQGLKSKVISKNQFSYFSEFASLKKIDSLRIRNNYNNSIKPSQPETKKFKKTNDLNNYKINAERDVSTMNFISDFKKITKFNNNVNYSYNRDNKKYIITKENINLDNYLQTNNSKNYPSNIFNYKGFKDNKTKFTLPKLNQSSNFPTTNSAVEELPPTNTKQKEAFINNLRNYDRLKIKANPNNNHNETIHNISNKSSVNDIKKDNFSNKFIDNAYQMKGFYEGNLNQSQNLKKVFDYKTEIQFLNPNYPLYNKFKSNPCVIHSHKSIFEDCKNYKDE